MKRNLIGGLLAAMLVLGLMAPAAIADVDGIAVFNGPAQVGSSFSETCTKKTSAVTGKGLGLPTVESTEPPTLEKKNNVWRFATTFGLLGTSQDGEDAYSGDFHACGYLSSPLNQQAVVGATCVSTKGQHGIGQADAVGTADTDKGLHLKLFNIGWKAALGGTLLVTGNYQELDHNKAKKNKFGSLYALVQVAPETDNATGCLDNSQDVFEVTGVAALVNEYYDYGKYDDDLFGEKKCAGGDCPTPGPQKTLPPN